VSALGQWVSGARLRTLPAAIAPVLVGTGAAASAGSARPLYALLALLVALGMQIGVNYANDYSDGIRGTDDDRVGPMRLVGSGTVSPARVKAAAFTSLGFAALAGTTVVALSGHWWLLAAGAAAVLAAWFYTGGRKPYGYRGLGEVAVFVFFGLMAVLGTTYIQADTINLAAVLGAVAIGLFASALLMANNLRDAPDDAQAGKKTLAVRLGPRAARLVFVGWLAAPYAAAAVIAALIEPWAALAWGSLPFAWRAVAPVVTGRTGRDLIPVLRDTGLAELSYAVLLGLGLLPW